MQYWATIIFPLMYKQCLTQSSSDMEPLLNQLSEQNLVNLVNVSDPSYNRTKKVYELTDPKSLLRQSWQETANNRLLIDVLWLSENSAGNDYLNKACYTMQITWRRAQRDLHRYFGMRENYEDTHEYEIGYLTHVIVSKYMNMLELYEMVDFRFMQHPDRSYAPTPWVWYMYTNVVEYSRAIIHACNMMKEIKKKYGMESGTTPSQDYDTVTLPDPEDMEVSKYQKILHDRFQKQLQDTKKKKLESRMRYKMIMKQPSANYKNYTTHRTKRPPQYWKWKPVAKGSVGGQDYGWSREQW